MSSGRQHGARIILLNNTCTRTSLGQTEGPVSVSRDTGWNGSALWDLASNEGPSIVKHCILTLQEASKKSWQLCVDHVSLVYQPCLLSRVSHYLVLLEAPVGGEKHLDEEIFDQKVLIAWELIQISVLLNSFCLMSVPLSTDQPEYLRLLWIINNLESGVLKGSHCIGLVGKDFDGLVRVVDNLFFQRTILLYSLMQLLDIKLGHHLSQSLELLIKIVRGHIIPGVQSGRSEAILLGKALQMILHKGMLIAYVFNRPHDGDIQAIRIIDCVSWRVDKASHFHIRHVTVSNDRANLIVQVPYCLATDSLAEDVDVCD